jgi:quinolinate synthase
MKTLIAEIDALKKARRAVVLAHNYTRADVQACADFTGDSLELARKATQVEAETIVFCGVYFMAETAAILNPEKTVLIPDAQAGCPMADMIDGGQLRALKAAHPGALAVCYVNSTAEVKAECDICVTSGNAEKVMASLPAGREILFVPDRHLGSHVAAKRGETYVLWPGYCPIHAQLAVEQIHAARAAHPGAPVLVHPECPAPVRAAADECLSTGGMCAYARTSPAKELVIGTETGILHRLRAENPEKTFWPVETQLVCADMKKVTLENLRDCLRDGKEKVVVPPEIAGKARRAIEAMLAVC